jgi:hypothetical protein
MDNQQEDELNIAKLKAEIRKLGVESDKLMMETRWYPAIVMGAVFATALAVAKLFVS